LGLFYTSCRAPGTPEHSWDATAQFGSGIGFKGMKAASQVIACTALDLLIRPTALKEVQKEFKRETRGFDYCSPI
jgi:aminobenzoyl-glutamate utilization protein B